MKVYKQQIIILVLIIFVLLASVCGVFLFKRINTKAPQAVISGEAEATMITTVNVLDGIWEPKRYSDELYYPIGITMMEGKLVVADSMCDRIQILDGNQNQRIGTPGQYGLAFLDSGALIDGYRENALFMKPSDVAVHPDGVIIICDSGNHVIRKMDEDFVITIAGNGQSGYKEGKEGDAQFNSPRSVAVDETGDIYVADTMNHCIRRIDEEGNVSLFAGTPTKSGYQDGMLAQAEFNEPCGLFLSPEGDLYVADSGNHSIRKIVDDMVVTIAGQPGEMERSTGYPKGDYVDGKNEEARFLFPRDIAMLPNGSLVVADSLNHAIRVVDEENTYTLLGGGMADQYYGSAENLKLTRPEGIFVDNEDLYISDSLNNRIIKVPLTERILEGRPHREQMLKSTGLTTDSSYAYKGDIRVYIDDEKVDMGRVPPWNTEDSVYIPIRSLLEALGATVLLDEKTDLLIVTIQDQDTILALNQDYFILKGTAVTTLNEVIRLFPYTCEWFPEFGLITFHIPSDLKENF